MLIPYPSTEDERGKLFTGMFSTNSVPPNVIIVQFKQAGYKPKLGQNSTGLYSEIGSKPEQSRSVV